MEKIKKLCKQCDTVEVKRGKLFCSIVCRNKYYSGDKSFRWKGGKRKCLDCDNLVARRDAIRCRNCSDKFRVGSRASCWKGGVTKIYNTIRNCAKYNEWRKKIYKRDNYACVNCGKRNGNGETVILNADHYPVKMSQIVKANSIDSYSKAIECEQLWDINNGRTLCIECHAAIDNFPINFRNIIKHTKYENTNYTRKKSRRCLSCLA